MKAHFAQVVEAIRDILEFQSAEQLTEDTLLETDLGMDSGLMLELIMQLEDSVEGLVIDQASISYEEFKSVGSVCDYIAARVQIAEPA
ncbi:acyl carrier protein [Tropicibacter oceani]|uniref:Phosphopantetheine-binding protein n=1 Tax=Tropicibacter oceani TaxID=3058420 RepID=A0ABY8QJ95_9RHOB|nr:phosphopantetheine-binding protein [Tropicibacter oceani]WGW04513.1 phosphopantetheine-binding protein [Tropicibacter oceani]